MAMQAENMDYDKLKELVDSLSCRSISPLVLPEVPLGSFTLMTFPMTKVEGTENPGVHYFDLIVDHADDIDFFGLSSSYKLACEKQDLALLPAPFGLKAACPKETTIQIAILKQPDGKKAILKHVSFPDKVKVSFVQQICFGSPYRPLFMKSNPKVGRKILQYCFENLGGHAFRCFDLSSQATRRGQSKTSMPFQDKEDAEIDEGFEHFAHCSKIFLRNGAAAVANQGTDKQVLSNLRLARCLDQAPWQRRNHIGQFPCHPCSMTVPSSPPWRRFGTLVSLL